MGISFFSNFGWFSNYNAIPKIKREGSKAEKGVRNKKRGALNE